MQQRTTKVTLRRRQSRLVRWESGSSSPAMIPMAACQCLRCSSRLGRSWQPLLTRMMPTRKSSMVSRVSLRGRSTARLSRLVPGRRCGSPQGAVHRFDNLGNEDVKQLAVISPAITGPAYFREAAEVIYAAAGGPPDRAKMMDVFRRHGMTLSVPPHVK